MLYSGVLPVLPLCNCMKRISYCLVVRKQILENFDWRSSLTHAIKTQNIILKV